MTSIPKVPTVHSSLLRAELKTELTPREAEIVEQVSSGASTRQVAQQLAISPHTVRNHLKVIFRKLQVHSRGELINRVRASPLPRTG